MTKSKIKSLEWSFVNKLFVNGELHSAANPVVFHSHIMGNGRFDSPFSDCHVIAPDELHSTETIVPKMNGA